MDEMRAYAMKLHTREQAPREGQAEAPKRQPMVSALSVGGRAQYSRLGACSGIQAAACQY